MTKKTKTSSQKKTKKTATIKFRSKFEETVAEALGLVCPDYEYETLRIPYVVERNYNPDFILPSGIIIEAKGYFKSADQRKHKLIKKQHPEKDIRFVFQKLVSVFKEANSLAPNGVSDTASCMQKEKSPKNGLRRKTKMAKRQDTDYIIIHCSATPPSMDVGAKEIDKWHRQRGWRKIGYHYVITRDGDIQEGRELDEIGAHCRGLNSTSVGVCLVGGVNGKANPKVTLPLNNGQASKSASKTYYFHIHMRKSQVTTNTHQKPVLHLMWKNGGNKR